MSSSASARFLVGCGLSLVCTFSGELSSAATGSKSQGPWLVNQAAWESDTLTWLERLMSSYLANGFSSPTRLEGESRLTVRAIGTGRIAGLRRASKVSPGMVTIEHRYMENGTLKRIYSRYQGLAATLVREGDFVHRNQWIGRVELRTARGGQLAYFSLSKPVDYVHKKPGTVEIEAMPMRDWAHFTEWHEHLTKPSEEPAIILVRKRDYVMHLYAYGKRVETYDVALSQNPRGHKERQGDNRLPEGEYRLIEKVKGPFKGKMAPYFGVAWMRLNYPNNADAHQGFVRGAISQNQRNAIVAANQAGRTPPKHTSLGGGHWDSRLGERLGCRW